MNEIHTLENVVAIFDKCLDLLRDDSFITGEKALKIITQFIILKLMEPHFGNFIDIDNYDYDLSEIPLLQRESYKEKMLKYVRFSVFITQPPENIPNIINFLWNYILSQHPATKKIFLKGKEPIMKDTKTYIKIIKNINKIQNTDIDILGCAYENLLKNVMQGRDLGQYFTQPILKNIMIDLINPVLKNDGTVETMCDPTLGTGGFLISFIQNIKKQSKEKNIKINWNFINNFGVYGKEIEPDTFNLSLSNMLIATGQPFENLECGDSIKNPINKKFDIIMSNPPFGIKGLIYKDFFGSNIEINNLINKHTPIVSNEAVSLFIQTIIYCLNVNGRCAVIIPDGQDLHGVSKQYILIRKYLMHTCDLQKIIFMPSNVFTNTGVKTCILYFIKKIETSDSLKIKIVFDKATQIEDLKKRKYEFNDILQTRNIEFYDYNIETKTQNLIISVPIEKIVNNKYSLNYLSYLEKKELNICEEIELKTIEEISIFMKKSNRNASAGKETGLYPFFKSSMNLNSFIDMADYNEECVIIGTGGNPSVKYSKNFSCSSDNIVFKTNSETILIKYIYCYFLNNIHILQELFKGATIKHLSKEDLKKIKIPIPNTDIQKNIIQKFDEQNDKIALLKSQIIACVEEQKFFMDNLLIKK